MIVGMAVLYYREAEFPFFFDMKENANFFLNELYRSGQGRLVYGTVELQHPSPHSILSMTFDINNYSFFPLFFLYL